MLTFCRVTLLILVVFLLPANAQTIELYMPDGQLNDNPVRLYISGIPDSLLTNLHLDPYNPSIQVHFSSNKNHIKDYRINPRVVTKNQLYQNHDGKMCTGTLLIFDVTDLAIEWYKPGVRVLPVLYHSNRPLVIGEREVYISHRKGAIVFTFLVMMPILILLYFLSPKSERRLLGLLSMADGRMSISLTQVFLWTIVVGSAVLIFAVSRLQVPHIPESLWVLMGLSVTTGVVGHYQTDRLKEHDKQIIDDPHDWPSLKQLITVTLPDGSQDADLSKAQLLFWTIVTLIIFVHKSFVMGALWDVPTSLLVLMGISQFGYVSRQQLQVINEEKKQVKG